MQSVNKVFLVSVSLLFVIYTLVIISIFISTTGNPEYHPRSDYSVPYSAANILVKNGSNDIYNLTLIKEFEKDLLTSNRQIEVLPNAWLPITIVFFVPLSYFNLATSYVAFLIINLLVLLFTFYKLIKELKINLIALALLFFYWPVQQALVKGNISIFLLTISFYIYFMLKKNNDVWAGVFTTFLLIKPQYLLLTPFIYIISKNRASFIKGFVVSGVIIFLTNVLITDLHTVLQYPIIVLQNNIPEFGSKDEHMFTLFSNLKVINLVKHDALLLITNFIGYLVVFWLFIKRYKLNHLERNFSAALLITIPFCIHVLDHDLSLLVIPITLVLANIRSLTASKVFLLLLLYLIPFIGVYMSTQSFLSYVLLSCGVVVLYGKSIRFS